MTWFPKSEVRRRTEVLSAYIDGRLPAKEKAEVERLVSTSIEWRRDLDQLQAAVHALREAPSPQPRRSYALTPEMTRGRLPATRESRLLRPLMSMATATAAVLLAVSIAGGSGLFGTGSPAREAAGTPGAGTAMDKLSAPSPAADGAPAPAAAPESPPTALRVSGAPEGTASPVAQATAEAYSTGEDLQFGPGGAGGAQPAANSGPAGPLPVEAGQDRSLWAALTVLSGVLTALFGYTTYRLHRKRTI
jgi:anti-sigma factor RsiW